MALLMNSMVHKVKAGGLAMVHEISDITNPLIHAVEQPIQGFMKEAKEIVPVPQFLYNTTVKLGTYFAVGWLGWTAFSETFPVEKRMLMQGIDRVIKRSRLR